MAVAETQDLRTYCVDVARERALASEELARASGQQKIDWLRRSAAMIRERADEIREANKADLAAAPGFGLTDAEIDRLRLTPARIEEIAAALEAVAALPDPVGEVIESTVRPNGLEVLKVRVPLGVVFFIYESRPNVTADAAAICVKSGNAVILRGGKEAIHSSRAIVEILGEALAEVGLPIDAVQQVSTTDREAVGHFLRLPEYIDRGDSPRRRGPDSPRRRRSENAGHQAFHRQLPRLCRSRGRSRHGREDHDQLEMPADGRVQRRRVAGGSRRCRTRIPAANRRGARRARHRNSRRRANAAIAFRSATAASEADFAAEYLGPDHFSQNRRFAG